MKITLSNPIELDVAAEDGTPRRTLTGIAVPYGVDANASTGPVRFEAGSLPTDGPAPKLIRDHDLSQPIGIVTARVDTGEAMLFEAKISATGAGDEALTLAADGVLDAVSVGVEVEKFHYDAGVLVVESGRWRELSLVPFGAFDAARVLDVAASDDVEPAPEPETPETPEPSEEDTMTESAPVEAAEAPAQIPTAPIAVTAAAAPKSAGHYFSAILRGEKVEAATGDTGDIPGILPEPIVGPLYDGLSARRRLVDALGVRQMPAGGKIFTIPKITTRPTVDEQAAEHDTLDSTAMVVGEVSVTKKTVGGFVDASEQMLDFSDPSALNILVEQLGKAYARDTESIACSALVAGSTYGGSVVDWTDADEVITAIFTAATTIAGRTGDMPTHLFLSPDRYKDLAVLQSTAGDFLFPSLNPMNAFGRLEASGFSGTPAGLELVVSTGFAAGKAIVGHPDSMRLFEQAKGAIRVEQPATLSTRVAWRGYFAAAFVDANWNYYL
jgi:hypothetical protein